jgi:IS1 family transposase
MTSVDKNRTKGSTVLICLLLLICVVTGKEFLHHRKITIWHVYSQFKTKNQRRSIGLCRECSVLGRYRLREVIRKIGLTNLVSETRVVSNASNEIESNKVARFIAIGNRSKLSSGRCNTNAQLPFGWLLNREQIEPSYGTNLGRIAKLLLVLHRIGRDDLFWRGGEHLRVNLNVLCNGVSDILDIKLEPQNRLIPVFSEDEAVYRFNVYRQPRSLLYFGCLPRLCQLLLHCSELVIIDRSNDSRKNQSPDGEIKWIGLVKPFQFRPIPYFLWLCALCAGWLLITYMLCQMLINCGGGRAPWGVLVALFLLAMSTAQFVNSLLRVSDCWDKSVTQKYLTRSNSCNTLIDMANVLSTDKQIAVIGALAEGSSIRSIERITGIHRDTIMRLGVRVGKGCEMLLDSKMQDLGCNYLQLDEVWGFIGKKERHCSVDDSPELGDVWTFCAIDSETKLVPSFKCGKRNAETANAFVRDIANRVRNRVQISTDALGAYADAVERAFGTDVDYGQIVKVYTHDAAQHPERKYSAPHFASAYRRPIAGNPEMELVSTSHVERLNATTRLHVKRLSRLTLAFSKKFENFQAAVALHFAYYNFVRRHNTLRCTPAMAAGVERDFWSVGDLVEATV